MEGKSKTGFSRFLQNLTGSMDMPQEVVLDIPKVTLIGGVQVQVENHRGVLEYTPTCIRVRTRDGVLVVTGGRLRIGSIFRDEVVVEGRIERIELAGDGAAGPDGERPA